MKSGHTASKIVGAVSREWIVVTAWLIVWLSTDETLGLKLVSPSKVTTIGWMPTENRPLYIEDPTARTLKVALILPVASSETPVARILVPSVIVTVPVGTPEPGVRCRMVAV